MTRPAVLVDPDWLEQAVTIIEQIANTRGTVTSEDLREATTPPEHQSHIGTAFRVAATKRLITSIGYRPSRDKSRKGGAIRVWTARHG